MFDITSETKTQAVDAMGEVFRERGVEVDEVVLGEAFDIAVKIVKAQFGF
jgi:hypothetical protein